MTKTNAPATTIIIGINIIVYILSMFMPNLSMRFGLIPSAIVYNHEYYRLITCMFLHFNMMHILMNMYALYGVGNYLELMLGTKQFVVIYMILGFTTELLSLIVRIMTGNTFVNSIGASGVIYALIGILIGKLALQIGLENALKQNTSTLLCLVFMCFIPGIDNYAHICGIILGIVVGMLI